jgi:hypothetical protein
MRVVYSNWRSPVKKGLKIPLFFYLLILSLFIILIPSIVTLAAEEYTRSAETEVSGKIRKFQLYTPGNLGGEVVIFTGEENVCQAGFECWARAKNRKMAQEFTELVEMSLDITDQVATLRFTTPREAPWEGSDYAIKVMLEVSIPSGIEVETKTRHFKLDISGPLERVFVENDFGEITVVEVTEETSIRGTYNKVEVKDLQGKVDIETTYNNIRAWDIDTKGKVASLETIHAVIEVKDFKGQLRARTIYAPMDLSGLNLIGGRNEIATMHSKIDIELEKIKGSQLLVTNAYGNINLQAHEELSARLIFIVGRGGKIETNRIPIRPQVLQKTRLEGICGDGDSEIQLDIEGIGRILLEGR